MLSYLVYSSLANGLSICQLETLFQISDNFLEHLSEGHHDILLLFLLSNRQIDSREKVAQLKVCFFKFGFTQLRVLLAKQPSMRELFIPFKQLWMTV